MSTPKLSVVIPAYNESTRLKSTLPQIIEFFDSQKYSSEIIISNDGSTDQTTQTIKKFAKKHPQLKLVDLPDNLGKGGALRQGILATTGKWVLFMDADLSTPLAELDKFWDFTPDHDVIIGSRKMTGAQITKHQSFIRENLGKIFTLLTNLLATKNLSDITCGFKLFKGDVARRLFAQGLLDDWSFDAEILFLAQKHHHPIKEVPVKWQNDPRTKVSMFRDGINALWGLIKIRTNSLLGRY